MERFNEIKDAHDQAWKQLLARPRGLYGEVKVAFMQAWVQHKKFLMGMLAASAILSLMGGYTSGSYRLTAVIASGIDAGGTVATTTLSESSPDCTFINRDGTASNTLDLTINGDTDTIRLYGGDSYNTASSDIPIWVASFSSAAVVGTPDLQFFCWGR